jgi:hypothetical protein
MPTKEGRSRFAGVSRKRLEKLVKSGDKKAGRGDSGRKVPAYLRKQIQAERNLRP